MAMYWPTPGFKGRTYKLCVLTRRDFDFCARSSPLRGRRGNRMEKRTRDGKEDIGWRRGNRMEKRTRLEKREQDGEENTGWRSGNRIEKRKQDVEEEAR